MRTIGATGAHKKEDLMRFLSLLLLLTLAGLANAAPQQTQQPPPAGAPPASAPEAQKPAATAAPTAAPQTPKTPAEADALARTAVAELVANQFDKVGAQFDAKMQEAVPQPQLVAGWNSLTTQVGAFKQITAVHVEPAGSNQRVLVTCAFEKKTLDALLVFSPAGQIAGMFFRPHAEDWNPPAYANAASFHEQPLTVVNGKFELPGTLTLPVNAGPSSHPLPAVVLVQGSGPHDEDESIGPNKPFKDLSEGLAGHGIAVFRYTKRTLKYGGESSQDPNTFTIDDETGSDARAAVALVATQPGIDPKRIFVVGHSQGAMMAPRIAAGDDQIAGIVMMAGNTRPLEQVIVDQIKYLISIQSSADKQADQGTQQIAAAEQAAKTIADPNLKPGTMVDVLGSKTPASYWLDLRNYHQTEVAAKLTIPIFILQGDRDYQVTKVEWDGWQKALAGHPNVTFKMYPKLNHLFMTGEGPGSPEEYDKPGHVSEEVITDIAVWVQAPGQKK
jgi:uncharacterized protein